MTLINERIEIDPTRPLPEFDTPFAKAYGARSKAAGASPMMALVCTTLLPPRSDLVLAERGSTHACFFHVREAGVVLWPLTNTKTFAFGMEMPVGQRMAHPNQGFTAMREEAAIERFITPLASGLAELARLGVFHGSIRPDMIYINSDESCPAILGDHMAHPAGFGQPAVFETIERGLAPDVARGIGGAGDDLYAFGVVIVAALTGDTPLKELREEAVVQLKMERGSYTALLGERRFGNGLTELLRGLLADDPKQRWGHADLTLWLEGRRLTPKQAMAMKKASRAMRFNNQDFLQPRQLAAALSADTRLAIAAIKSDEVARWLGHGLNDEGAVARAAESALLTRRQRAGSEEERLVANTILALDPGGPIRYRGLSMFPAGIPGLLADMVLKETPPGLLVDIIQNDMPTHWLAAQTDKRPDMVTAANIIERVKEYIDKSALGFGVERALYELNPMLACLSPTVRDYYPVTLRQLMEALDKRASNAPIDRHVAAFILSRDGKTTAPIMRMIADARDQGEKGVALLTLFSDLQYRFGPDKLTGLGAALLPLAEDSVKRFHNRMRQEKLRKDLKIAAAEGKLSAMLALIDDPDLIERDEQEYAAARILYQQTENEAMRMAAYSRNKKALAVEAGEPLASTLAVGLAFLLLCYVVIRAFA